ncbi:hypothetical protein ACLOJK_039310 [Asimina triloba]
MSPYCSEMESPITQHPQQVAETPTLEIDDRCRLNSTDDLPAMATLHSLILKEKQISVDPVSLIQSTKSGDEKPSAADTIASADVLAALALPPPKPKFLSASLPSSVASSPNSGLAAVNNRKQWKNQCQASPLSIISLARQHSYVFQRFSQEPKGLRKSKSCAEQSSCPPSIEFDLYSKKLNTPIEGHKDDGCYRRKDAAPDARASDPFDDDGFKCGALCLFLPGFSNKAKQVRPKRVDDGNIISRVVSLEKFECGSWSSSAIMHDESDDSMQLYFDLPLELIRNTTNDAHSPVATAFVFDSDRKGGLKKSTTRKSHELTRHVRFSTSAPESYPSSPVSCVTPRLRKAREEFSAYLEEAQRA